MCIYMYICVQIDGETKRLCGSKGEGCKMLTGIRITVMAKYSWASFCLSISVSFFSGRNDAHIRPHCCSYAERVRDSRKPFSPLASTWLMDTLPTKSLILPVFFTLSICRFYPPYSITNRMIAQPAMSPYISPVSTYPACIDPVWDKLWRIGPIFIFVDFLATFIEFELMIDKLRAVSFRHGVSSRGFLSCPLWKIQIKKPNG